jgi:hypothetical protein
MTEIFNIVFPPSLRRSSNADAKDGAAVSG